MHLVDGFYAFATLQRRRRYCVFRMSVRRVRPISHAWLEESWWHLQRI